MAPLPGHHRLVLLVEDNPAERAALTATARRLGFAVLAAEDAEQGRRYLENSSPDLVLCDFDIPGGGGFSVLERARTLRSRLPFVLMTSHTDPAIREEALRLGATLFLSKPLSLTRVDEAIRQALAARPQH